MTSAIPKSPLPSLQHLEARRVLQVRAAKAVASSWGVTTSDVTIWECPVTKMRFRDTTQAPELAQFYVPAYHESMTGGSEANRRSRAYRRENEIRAAELRRHTHRGRVLDVGCSRGDFAQAIRDTGLEAHGLDIAPEACAQAERTLGAGRVTCGSLEEHASRMAGQFAAVTLMDVIEHSSDVVRMLQAIHLVLEPGGILFLRTPTLSSPFHTLATLSYRLSLGLYKAALFKLYHAEHLYFFNEVGIRRLLDDCGFETLELIPDPLCWENFRTAELNQGMVGNGALALTYFLGRALKRGHGMKVIARRRDGFKTGRAG
jgi:2-polyprenyl-3-methyl-5-hydroxy-6-metoxy-1,4-benzoquinol methylase